MTAPHILILGGTGEARCLAQRLVSRGGLKVTLSLAGRTAAPLAQAGNLRRGGFGGAKGLVDWLRANGVDILLDATHPFAARISANARLAARETGTKLIALARPQWRPVQGDCWFHAADVGEAAGMLGAKPRTVFLAIGRQELEPFSAYPKHRYIVRSVDAVAADQRLPGARYILDRGPFAKEAERALFTAEGVDLIVAKNSGGDATYAKIAAARALSLPVIMVRRPGEERADARTVVEALAMIDHAVGLPVERGE